MREPLCIDCGLSAEEHHSFRPFAVPLGCECDPRDWANPHAIRAICPKFVVGPEDGQCGNCEHDEACHKVQP